MVRVLRIMIPFSLIAFASTRFINLAHFQFFSCIELFNEKVPTEMGAVKPHQKMMNAGAPQCRHEFSSVKFLDLCVIIVTGSGKLVLSVHKILSSHCINNNYISSSIFEKAQVAKSFP